MSTPTSGQETLPEDVVDDADEGERELAEKDLASECEFCGGEGVTYEDEFENGQCVGRGTITRKCICRMRDPDDYQETDPDK